ncbi:MAG: hypothetical protein ACRDWW_07530, partial [Acidimicrobiales bacterium]
ARAGRLARELGARKVTEVAAGGAFHTTYMRPARDRLQKALAMTTFHEAETTVVTNVDGLPHVGAADWPSLLRAQLCNPVRWRQSILRLGGLSDRGTDTERLFVELGPGDSLTTMVRHTLPSVVTATVSVPADLDRLVDAVSGDTALHTYALVHQGEQLYVSERVVISPGPGVFDPAPGLDGAAGTDIHVGTLIGTVGSSEVRSPFEGRLEGVLAHRGERVQTGQPIAWLHAP